jgi:hypothetical protein
MPRPYSAYTIEVVPVLEVVLEALVVLVVRRKKGVRR